MSDRPDNLMGADNFHWLPSMKGDRCAMTVVHKLSGRTWSREFDEGEWAAVREDLLATIEQDLRAPPS